ncbi:MAG: tRNA (adenosine(37)-N6)-threonylcarbamoyltransferase complex dimerization subunit type 1 TsaB [Xanthomonadaceae bacterium]|nr:tRNA (adenosine(37)-N6)-threonylcarbamoyltransferase complex dimerization subunit type 1 TsaB [Rhodospirillaceae bacterium]NIA18135.1 tRNA (adenosine(37)-N6)-threonylcarbamoyltransferase complex dimerization subunit type 1 TsaB [Xanthomonadaceae bacterium]
MFLFINTARKNKIEVALFDINKNNKIKILNKMTSRAKSDKLLIIIDKLLQKEKASLGKLKRIFVVNGPGPFTAVRMAIATANTLAYGLNIPVRGVKFEKNKNIENLIKFYCQPLKDMKIKKYVKPREDFDFYSKFK